MDSLWWRDHAATAPVDNEAGPCGNSLGNWMGHRILVVEDQKDIAELIALHIRDLGHRVDTLSDGNAGLQAVRVERYDLVVLDVMLPGRDGLDVVRTMRIERIPTPVLMLTARSSELDRVLGLELGADDYLTKPFSIPELQARVKAMLRRAEMAAQPPAAAERRIVAGELSLDCEAREVRLRGRSVPLTSKEYDLLCHFARHPGRAFTRVQLLDAVWGTTYEGYEHNVNTHINRLRSKIEDDPANPRYVLTVRGVGYRFTDQR
jgi:DNA-binding response OmpR family regulator